VNGSMGAVYHIAWEDRQDPSTLPLIILIKFNEYNGPDFVYYISGIIPDFPATRHFDIKEWQVPYPVPFIACICNHGL
jgi:hypothetical protein